MRQITVRFPGDCRRCGAALGVGATAVYERRVGLWCPSCAPTDPEDIRAARTEAAERKAARLEGWAERRESTAGATLETIRERFRGDHAFNTQPGPIPERARVVRREDRAHESLRIARNLRARAEGLRVVRVAGDAERTREAKRAEVRQWIRVGMRVTEPIYGPGVVVRIYRKTAKVQTEDRGTHAVCLSWLRPLELPHAGVGGGAT